MLGLLGLRSLRRQRQRPRGGTRPPRAQDPWQGRQVRADPATTSGSPSNRPRRRRPRPRFDPAQRPRRPDGPARGHPPAEAAGRHGGNPDPAARHADPRTTMRYDRARKNLDRHPNYILAAYMASGSRPSGGTPGSPAYACATADQSVCARRLSGRTIGNTGHDFAGTWTAPWRSISERIVETLR